MEHAVQHDPTCAGFKPWVGALVGLLLCLDLEVKGPVKWSAKHVALERRGVCREGASFQTNVERAHFCLEIAFTHGALPIQPTGLHTKLVVQHIVMSTDLVQPRTVSLGQAHHRARIA